MWVMGQANEDMLSDRDYGGDQVCMPEAVYET